MEILPLYPHGPGAGIRAALARAEHTGDCSVRGLIPGCPLRFHYPRRMDPAEGLFAGQQRIYVTAQVQAGPGSGASSARTVPSMRP